MKITPTEPKKSKFNTGKDELKIIDFEEKQDETIWEKVGRFLKWGLTAYDKRGHTTEVRFRTKPHTRDMVGEIRTLLPDGYFKTQSHLYRAIFGVGCVVAIHHMKKKGIKGMEKIEAVFDFMNIVARDERLADIKSDVKQLKNEIIENGHMETEEMIAKFKELDKLVKKLEKDI